MQLLFIYVGMLLLIYHSHYAGMIGLLHLHFRFAHVRFWRKPTWCSHAFGVPMLMPVCFAHAGMMLPCFWCQYSLILEKRMTKCGNNAIWQPITLYIDLSWRYHLDRSNMISFIFTLILYDVPHIHFDLEAVKFWRKAKLMSVSSVKSN